MATRSSKAKTKADDLEVVPVDEQAAKADDGDEVVIIWHPETPGSATAQTTRAGYRELWASKGFRIVASEERDAAGKLSYTLEPALPASEIEDPEGVDAQGSTTGDTPGASSSAGASDAGSS